MPSPNWDTLNTRLSRLVGDAVSAATADGKRYASSIRDRALNNAGREFLKTAAVTKRWPAIRAYVRTATGNLNGSKVLAVSSFNPTVHIIKSVYNTTKGRIVDRPPDGINRLEVENSPVTGLFSSLYWEWENSDIVVINGSTNDSMKVEYVKQWSDFSANGASDVDIESTYWDELLDRAARILLEENPTPTNISMATIKDSRAKELLATGRDAN